MLLRIPTLNLVRGSPRKNKPSNIVNTERLKKGWTAPIYAFYDPTPEVGYENSRRYHLFRCAGRGCKKAIRRYLDTGDSSSTANLRKHAKACWGVEAVEAAQSVRDIQEARESVVKPLARNGSIASAFEHQGKGVITYSNRQHTRTETR
jgi:endonuclease V-like protein UPF0215 family